MTPEHERYVWLRDRKSLYGGYCGRAPYIISPNKSRLYAMHALTNRALDIEVDADILASTAQTLHTQNEVIEQGLMEYPVDTFGDEYSDVLYKLAQKSLGWDDQRFGDALRFV